MEVPGRGRGRGAQENHMNARSPPTLTLRSPLGSGSHAHTVSHARHAHHARHERSEYDFPARHFQVSK
eukprot:6526113-Karenia_brevis.AAC.1